MKFLVLKKEKQNAQKIRENVGVVPKSAYVIYEWPLSGSWDRCTPEIDAPESTESSIEEEPMYEKKLLSIPNNGANRRWGFDAGIKPRFMEQKVSFDVFHFF